MLSFGLAIILAAIAYFNLKLTLYRTFLLLVIGIGISILLNMHFQPKDTELDAKMLDKRYFIVLNTFKLISHVGKDGKTAMYYSLGKYKGGEYVTFSYFMRDGEPTTSKMPIRLVRFVNDNRNEVDLLFYTRKKHGNLLLSILPYKETAVCYEIHSKWGEILK